MYLNCHSYHSLRYGTIPLKDLVQQAVANNVTALALTDINTVIGIYDFVKECQAVDIKPIVGMEFRQDNKLLYIGLAQARSGIGEMNRLLTKHNFDNTLLPVIAPDFENVIVIYPVENAPNELKEHEFIGIRPEQLLWLFRSEWKNRINKMVVLQPVTYRIDYNAVSKERLKEFYLHKVLRAIDLNVILTKLEPDDHCNKTEVFAPQEELLAQYNEFPVIVGNTAKIIEQCNFEYEFGVPKNKKHYTSSKEEDIKLLTKLTEEGFTKRYSEDNAEARKRVARELKVIDELNFCGYFLITWDIVNYSYSRGFMHIGRGSGANSIIADCLGITDICPLELDLYFERFLNLNRKSPPDFDIDWSWAERDEILTYIFYKFGREHVAFCGTNVEFKYRSIFREVGKVFGLPKEELDILAKNPIQVHDKNHVVKLVHEYGMMLEKYPNQRSMHSCGIIISEDPITDYTALEMPPKGFPIVQFDMHIAEDIGFEKFDILSQRGIGHINDAAKLIKKNRGH
jgi:error-prone DNA polymerase